ncbi:MAG: hypothetical protein AUH41_12955 [Gemmatimonadetes bacterium 13_1_40CM_66_11]|nr:MAG: hypothetical protein AUH41_12955 [Gemmatimonadetes bacterium 13_1_40CM_66_11]
MKRILVIVGLLFGLATGVAQAQTRVGVSLSFGDPYLGGHVVIGSPYYYRYSRPYYYRYHPAPYIVVAPGVYRAPRVIVVRPHRGYVRRYHRGRW